MKIAIYIQDMRASGVVRTMIGLARSYQVSDDVVLVAGYAAGIFGAKDVAPAGFVAAAGRPKGLLPRLTIVRRLRRTLRELVPDVVLSGGNFGHFSLWAATRGLGLPVVYVFSNPLERSNQPWRNRWRRIWSRILMRGSAGAILVGSNIARSVVFRPYLAAGRAEVIPNGIDLAGVPEPDGSIPEPMAGADPVILSIGRIQPQKNFEALIDAVAVTRRSRPVRLVILGAGDEAYRRTLIARATARGIASDVVFAGTTDTVYPWLRAARVFALASRWEGSSIALLEAMAAQTPVVASHSAGDAAEVLDHGRYGLLADAEDAGAFAAALLRQLERPIHPRDRVRDFDAAAMMRAYHAVLTAATARSGARKPWAHAGTHPSR